MKILIAIFLVMIGLTAWAVEPAPAEFQAVDILTYRLYMEQKWDSLILIGKQAIRDHIDYYYLRARLGIAYFEKQAYYPAVNHLQKARKFNADDPVIASYLYFALKYTDRAEEAGHLKSLMLPESRKLAENGEHFLEVVHAGGGYTISSASAPVSSVSLMEKDSIYGEQDLYGNNIFTQAGLRLKLTNRLNLTVDYSFLEFDKTKYIQYGQGEAHVSEIRDTSWGKVWYYDFPWVTYDTSFRYKVRQQEVHLGLLFSPGAGFRIQPAFHYIHVASPRFSAGYRFDTVDLPAWYTGFDSTLYTFPFSRLSYNFSSTDTAFSNYVAGLRISKDIGRINAAVFGSWSNLNGETQKQIGMSLTYFPLGNLNFYGTTSVTGFIQGKNDQRLLLGQVIGFRITSWLWGEGNVLYGDYTNANILNGSIVFNNSDRMVLRTGGTLTFVISPHWQCSVVYQYTKKESQQYYYKKVQSTGTQEINEVQKIKYNPYHTQLILGGITWKL